MSDEETYEQEEQAYEDNNADAEAGADADADAGGYENNDAEEAEPQAYEEADAKQEPDPEPEPEPEPEPANDYSNNNNESVETPASVEDAFNILSSDTPTFNWFAAVPKSAKMKTPELTMERTGNGGLDEITVFLKERETQIVFVLLRVNTYDDANSSRAKFLLIKFVGTKVPFMQKAKLTPQLGSITATFPVVHLTKEMDESLTGFDPKALSLEFLRIGGAHKPNKYEYGTNQVYTRE